MPEIVIKIGTSSDNTHDFCQIAGGAGFIVALSYTGLICKLILKTNPYEFS